MINVAIKLAATVAMEALQMGLQASQRTKGPRLDELSVTTAEYGTPLPRFRGARKFSCPIFHAESLKEVETTTKVKGAGKQTNYHYLGTFACAIADCEIDTVLKIFFDDKLVYDATGVGPISYASVIGVDLLSVMRIYTGTETQLPDPRYVTYCEAKYGPNSAPAYRGVSYLFFEELPLDNFGNRIPQITVIATAAASSTLPYESLTDNGGSYTDQMEISKTGEWLIRYNAGRIEWWDVASRSQLGVSVAASGLADGNMVNIDLASDGTAYWIDQFDSGGSAFSALYICPPVGGISRSAATSAPWFSGPTRVFDTTAGRFVYSAVPHDHTGYCSDGGLVADAFCGCDFAQKSDGVVYGLFEPTTTSDQVVIIPLSGSGTGVTFTGTMRSTPNSPTFCHVGSQNHWFVVTDGHWYTIDDTTGAIKASGVFSALTNNLPRKNPVYDSFWSGYTEISLVDGSVIRTVNPTDWVFEDSGTGLTAYSPMLNALVAHPHFLSHITVRYLDRAGNAGTTLKTIVDAMCDAAGLTERDTAALTQTVDGYSWTRGDIKSQMQPVLDIHDVDVRPHDWLIEFLPRGNAAVGSILTQDFAKGGNAERYQITIKQDTELSQTLRVNFADDTADQQTNNVISILPAAAVDSRNDNVIDLTTYAATPDKAQQLGDRYLRREWNSRYSIQLSLTEQELAIEPCDVKNITVDGNVGSWRLDQITMVGTRIESTFIRDETYWSNLNASSVAAGLDARDPATIQTPAPVRGFIIDGPYREDTDADVKPLLFTGAGSYAQKTFPGATVYEATGSPLAYDQLFATISTGATWGSCNTTLGNANPNLWDRGNTLNITLQNGTLTNCAEADIDADPTLNLIAVGQQGAWEYINFCTATLNGDGSYTLSDFKRGRRGTEWVCPIHAASETFILCSAVKAVEMGASDIGASDSFKVQAVGRSLDSAPAVDVSPYTAATLKPYAPARIDWTTDGTDMFGTITRRTRVGGAWVGGSTIPLSEASEKYDIEIYNGGVLKRTISITGTNTFTYAGADIATDGNTVGTAPSVKVYQLSDIVGRGYALAA